MHPSLVLQLRRRPTAELRTDAVYRRLPAGQVLGGVPVGLLLPGTKGLDNRFESQSNDLEAEEPSEVQTINTPGMLEGIDERGQLVMQPVRPLDPFVDLEELQPESRIAAILVEVLADLQAARRAVEVPLTAPSARETLAHDVAPGLPLLVVLVDVDPERPLVVTVAAVISLRILRGLRRWVSLRCSWSWAASTVSWSKSNAIAERPT